ncbi:MAG: hypothetical protein KF773_24565 [Deltaproteobacteria bacterium]|nr:hypothetical protein [Deltaproteobacteria bacterium]
MRGLAIAVVLLASTVARAEPGIDVALDLRGLPQIRALIGGIRPMPLDQFALRAEDGTTAKAIKVEPVAEPIAIALVYSGWEIWIGNDELDVMPPRSPGALRYLVAALDEAPFARAGGPGSQIVAIEYSQGTRVKVPLRDLDAFRGAELGKQADYRDKLQNDLADGVALAIGELAKAKAPRKAILVIGDGSDTNPETAPARLRELRRRAASERITMLEAIVLRSPMSSSSRVIDELVGGPPVQIAAAEGLRAAVARIAGRLADRRLAVTFDGSGLTIDPAHPRIDVSIGTETRSISLDLARDAPPPPPDDAWWTAPWRWAVVAGGLVALGGLLVVLLRIRASAMRAG